MSEKKLIPNLSMVEARESAYRNAQSRLLVILESMGTELPPYVCDAVNEAVTKREAWYNEPLYREE
jgi:hypothetical protein